MIFLVVLLNPKVENQKLGDIGIQFCSNLPKQGRFIPTKKDSISHGVLAHLDVPINCLNYE